VEIISENYNGLIQDWSNQNLGPRDLVRTTLRRFIVLTTPSHLSMLQYLGPDRDRL